MEPLLICTDLDRTLIPNGVQSESSNARLLFSRLVSLPEVKLVYVSGRHRALVQQAIGVYNLPLPDYVIGDVGTVIYQVAGSESWHPSEAWEREIGTSWPTGAHDQLRQLFGDLKDLRLQEPSKQARYKLSYFVPLQANRGRLMQRMRERLEQEGIATHMVWSVDEPAGVGLLDLLPLGASKLHAVEFLMAELGFSCSNTIFAGDSGNDMEVLVSAIPSVLVANSPSAVREQVLRRADENNNSGRIYMAKGGFLGMNGNYAAGILEGVVHFHPGLADTLQGLHS